MVWKINFELVSTKIDTKSPAKTAGLFYCLKLFFCPSEGNLLIEIPVVEIIRVKDRNPEYFNSDR